MSKYRNKKTVLDGISMQEFIEYSDKTLRESCEETEAKLFNDLWECRFHDPDQDE